MRIMPCGNKKRRAQDANARRKLRKRGIKIDRAKWDSGFKLPVHHMSIGQLIGLKKGGQ